MIEKIAAKNLTYKSPAHEAKVCSVVESFFDTFFGKDADSLNALVGTTEAEVEETTEEGKDLATSEVEESPADDFED